MARKAGCDCNPDIELTGADADGIEHIAVKHDNWCSLYQRLGADHN